MIESQADKHRFVWEFPAGLSVHLRRLQALMTRCLAPVCCLYFSALFPALAAGDTWTPLVNPAPEAVTLMVLLEDGTVMAVNEGKAWYQLTPDAHGSYANGAWTTLAPMHDTRLYYASDVLKDGRVFVAGGEYDTGEKAGEVYDPVRNVWTPTPSSGQDFLDAVSELLNDGRVLVAPVSGPDSTIIYDPVANTWTKGPDALGNTD
jgi:hypothetical protein